MFTVIREEQADHKFCCLRCNAHMGDVTAAGLVVGICRLQQAVTMYCVACGRINKWYPPKGIPRHTATAQVNQSEAVASLIRQSISEGDKQRLSAAKEAHSPRRDPYIDAAEEEADNLLYESIANRERVKKRA